jgi:methionine aminotransferase
MIQSKLPNVKESIFSTMTSLAEQYKAINLSQGFPDFKVSSNLIKLVTKKMQDGHNQYAPMPGVLELRQKIATKTEKLYGFAFNPDTEITITAGATQGLFTAFTAFLKENDEVIIFEPAYDQYAPTIRLNGATPVYVTLKTPDYSIDWEEVKKVINARTKMIIINSPHNPTGAVLSEDDLKALSKIVAGSKIIVLSDEVYEHIVFDELKHESVAKYPDLVQRSIIFGSFGKTFHATGWKIGYVLAPENLMKEFRKVHQFVVFAVNTPIQYALAEHLDNEIEYLELGNFYQQKRDYFSALITSETKFKVIPTHGTYFQLVSFDGLSELKDREFAEFLVKEHGVASIPVSEFYHDKLNEKVLRFCFAKSNATLDAAIKRLKKIN